MLFFYKVLIFFGRVGGIFILVVRILGVIFIIFIIVIILDIIIDLDIVFIIVVGGIDRGVRSL